MKREPSLHITESRLSQILKDWWDDTALPLGFNTEEFSKYILHKAKPYSIETRTISITNAKLERQVNTKVSNDKTDYNLLSDIIFMVRKSLKHKGIKSIDLASAEYSQLKKLTKTINQFCNDFNLGKRAGYIEYVKAGLKKISSFRGYLTKLNDMSESISLEYEVGALIRKDEYKGQTKEVHDFYVSMVSIKTGINSRYEDQPIIYIHFMKVRELASKYGVDFKTYIKAQFEGLEWTGNYPQPAQLVNEKSLERLNQYLYQNKKERVSIETEKKPVDKGLVNILKRIRDGHDNDE